MLRRGMYAVAVLLLGAALGVAQLPDTGKGTLAVAKPLERAPARPVDASPVGGLPIQPVVYQPDGPPAVSPPLSPPVQGSLLSIEAVGPASIAPDQPLPYEIIVRNAGSNTLGRVRIEDVLPPGAKLRSAEPEAEVQTDHLAWNLGNLEAGAERRIKVEIQPGPSGEVTVTPTATFTLAKPCHTRIVRPPFAVTQTVVETAARGLVTFQIQVANYSDQTINKVVLRDTLPVGLLRGDDYERLYNKPAAAPGVPPTTAETPPVRDIISDAITSLAPGETRTINLPVYAVQSGRMTNQLTATAEGGWKAESQASVLITETPLVVRLESAAQTLAGQDVDVRLEVSNPGTAPAMNVRVTQMIPDGVDFLNASTAGTMDAARRMVYWTLGTLPPGQKQTLTLKTRGKTAGDWIFKAAATTDGAPEATAFQTVHIDMAPSLALDIVHHEAAIDLGAESVYEVRVLNVGTTPTPNVRLIATVSAGLLVLSAEGPTTVKVQPGQIVFEPLTQMAGRSSTTYRIHVKGQTAGDWGMTVQATADQLAKPLVQQVSTRVMTR